MDDPNQDKEVGKYHPQIFDGSDPERWLIWENNMIHQTTVRKKPESIM